MSYIATYTGRIFDYNNITKDSIYIPDILHSLPRINRFVGHSSRAFSVGEHTFFGLLMAEKLGYTPLQKLHWFIHDFTEAYVGDCPAPLKRLLPMFSEIEAKVEKAILDHLGLEPLTEEEFRLVKRIDMTMLALEMRDLTLHNHKEFIDHCTYIEILDDKDFNLGGGMTEKMLHDSLCAIFEALLSEYREGL